MADEYQAAKSSKRWCWIIIGVVAVAIVGVIIGVYIAGAEESFEWWGGIVVNDEYQ